MLILGETGVGKEVLAETLHQLSAAPGAVRPRQLRRHRAERCSRASCSVTRRAPSPAPPTRTPGCSRRPTAARVFLDEVGELPRPAQAKLLRVLETREVLRVGGVRPIDVDVRFVAATNRDLPSEVGARHASAAICSIRLDGVTLVIPPLRERRDEIAPLALQFLQAAHDKRDASRRGSAAAARSASRARLARQRARAEGGDREARCCWPAAARSDRPTSC